MSELSDLFKKIDYDAKLLEIEEDHFTTSGYNKFTRDILDAKIKKKELVNKCKLLDLVKKNLT